MRGFERVRQLDPADVGPAINLGQIDLEQQQYEAAIPLLRAATAEEPYNVTAAYKLGLALTRSGHTDEGSRCCNGAQALRATGYAVTYGTGYLEQGRYAEAMTSTGAEPELVDVAVPRVTFTGGADRDAAGCGERAASPFGRRFSAADLSPTACSRSRAGLGGCVALVDCDGDGQLDLFEASTAGQRLLHNDGGQLRRRHGGVRHSIAPAGAVAYRLLVGDFDNDGKPTCSCCAPAAASLYRNDGKGHFTDVTAAAGMPAYPALPGAAAFVDVDHDGDVDLLIAGLADVAATRASGGRGARVSRRTSRRRRSSCCATTATARSPTSRASARLDRDAARDRDRADRLRQPPRHRSARRRTATRPPLLFRTMRDGTFRDVAGEVGLDRGRRRGDDHRRRGRRRQQGRLPRLLLRARRAAACSR